MRIRLNEIDLVAINDLKKEITLVDIKLDRSRINLNALKTTVEDVFGGQDDLAGVMS